MFKNAQRLKDHLKVHEQREEDLLALAEKVQDSEVEEDEHQRKRKRRRSEAFEDGGKSPKLRPIRSGEAGKDFACPEPGCEKRFKAVRQLVLDILSCGRLTLRQIRSRPITKSSTSKSDPTYAQSTIAEKHSPTCVT